METPTDPAGAIKQGRSLLAQGRVRDAMQLASQLGTQYPDDPRALVFIAETAAAARDARVAELALRRAVMRAPNDEQIRLMYARALASNGKPDAAVPELLHSASLRPDDTAHLQSVGAHLSRLGDQHRAHDMFQSALELDPDNPQLCQNLAAVHRFLGNLNEAEAFAERAVRLDPMTPEAVFIRSDVRTVKPDNNHIDDIRELIASGKVSGTVLTQCYFALAKEYEDIGNYDDAFEALREACALRRKSFSYDVATDLGRMADIRRCYDAEFFGRQHRGHRGDKTPVFVLGMPRTGSTLLERFLAAHSRVSTAGERQEFSVLLAQQTHRILQDSGRGREHLVKASVEMDFEKLGRDYLAVMDRTVGDAPYFIDKLPFNFLYVGLILTALPDARIVHTVRHPMDTCYAVFKALFDQAYPFSYDLEELAQYFLAYRQLMQHWTNLFGERIIEIRYEDVVRDTENTVRRAVNSLGLEWEDACLSNRGRDDASTTASAAQARRPVYATSVGMWRNYERQLEPLRERFEAAGIDID